MQTLIASTTFFTTLATAAELGLTDQHAAINVLAEVSSQVDAGCPGYGCGGCYNHCGGCGCHNHCDCDCDSTDTDVEPPNPCDCIE